MSLSLIGIALLAALLHASWNALAKSGGRAEFSIASYQLLGAVLCVFLLPLVPLPHVDSWPYIFASVVIHNIYYFTLAAAYRAGDLSQVYPLFRGLAPVLVTVGAIWFADEWLPAGSLAGIVLISIGLMSLTFLGRHLGHIPRTALIWGLVTSVLIGAYTITDGLGVRLAGDPYSYIVWLFIFEPVPICLILLMRQRREFLNFVQSNRGRILMGGTFSSAAYALVIYAMSFGAMGLVSSLRESSVIFAAIIGSIFLKEPFGRQRIIAATLVAAGIIMMRLFA
ncbi:MAG: DMT family transporter [Pseudomonadota bacterium]